MYIYVSVFDDAFIYRYSSSTSRWEKVSFNTYMYIHISLHNPSSDNAICQPDVSASVIHALVICVYQQGVCDAMTTSQVRYKCVMHRLNKMLPGIHACTRTQTHNQWWQRSPVCRSKRETACPYAAGHTRRGHFDQSYTQLPRLPAVIFYRILYCFIYFIRIEHLTFFTSITLHEIAYTPIYTCERFFVPLTITSLERLDATPSSKKVCTLQSNHKTDVYAYMHMWACVYNKFTRNQHQ